MTKEEFGDRLRALRLQKRLSQGELAARIPTDQKRVSVWENGHSMPELLSIRRLCQVLEVSADELLGLKTKCDQ